MAQIMERARARDAARTKERQPLDPSKFLILSIDGGGMRGVITTIVLERLCKRFPTLLDRVGLVAGTSNGSMVAMCKLYACCAGRACCCLFTAYQLASPFR